MTGNQELKGRGLNGREKKNDGAIYISVHQFCPKWQPVKDRQNCKSFIDSHFWIEVIKIPLVDAIFIILVIP